MEKLYGKLIICIVDDFFSNLISFSYELEMQNLSWPFQFQIIALFRFSQNQPTTEEMLNLSFQSYFIKNL